MSEAVKNRIIGAAGPIFAQKGFAGTTVREICSAAKINQAAINYYFGSKENLYKDVFTSTYSSMKPWADLAADPKKQTEARRRFPNFDDFFSDLIVRRAKEFFATELSRWKVQLIFREINDPTPCCGDRLQEYIVRDYTALNSLLDEYFEPDVPQEFRWKCIFSIMGTIFFYKSSGWVMQKLLPDDMRQEHFLPEQIATFAVQQFFATASPYRKKSEPQP